MDRRRLFLLLMIIGIILVAANCTRKIKEIFTPAFTISPTAVYVGRDITVNPLGVGNFHQHTVLMEKGEKVGEYNGPISPVMFTVTDAGSVVIRNTVFHSTEDATSSATVVAIHSYPVAIIEATRIAVGEEEMMQLSGQRSYNPDESWLRGATVTEFRWEKDGKMISEGDKVIYIPVPEATVTVMLEVRDQLGTPATDAIRILPTGEATAATTQVTVPQVVTLDATEVATDSAILRGKILNNGGSAVSSYGFVFNDEVITAANIADNVFSVEVKDLTPDTTYSFFAFAKNEKGIGQGEEKLFKTAATTTTPATVAVSITVTNVEIPSDESYVKYTLSYEPESLQSTWTGIFYFAPDDGASFTEIDVAADNTYTYTGYAAGSGLHDSRFRYVVKNNVEGDVLGEAATSVLIYLP